MRDDGNIDGLGSMLSIRQGTSKDAHWTIVVFLDLMNLKILLAIAAMRVPYR